MVHPHFNHHCLGTGIHVQQRHWHPNVIIEVGVGLGDVHLGRQDGCNHVFSGRLAIAAGYRHNHWINLMQVVLAKGLQSRQGIVDYQAGVAVSDVIVIRRPQGCRRPVFEGIRDKFMPILSAGQWHK